MPVLHDRYIIFILIPILTLISALIYEIKNPNYKKITILILVLANISHLYYELNNKTLYKPEVNKILESINNTSTNEFTRNIYIDKKTNPPNFRNYVMRTRNFLHNNFKILKDTKSLNDKGFWLICYSGNNRLNCPDSNIEGKLKSEITLRKKRIIAEYIKNIEN